MSINVNRNLEKEIDYIRVNSTLLRKRKEKEITILHQGSAGVELESVGPTLLHPWCLRVRPSSGR